MGFEECPVCARDHKNHAVWLMSDDPEIDEAVRKSREYPSVSISPVEGGITGWNTSRGRTIQVHSKKREYENFEVVTGWDSTEHYGESVDYPTYTTLCKDVETGLLVIDKDAFEKWINT